jgi:hypothetical protein
MTDSNAPGRFSERLARFLHTAYRRVLWIIVLSIILGMSAYSLFFVARHFGVPPLFAILMSTCFDGAALILADLSLRSVQSGQSGSSARVTVWALAGTSAYLQTFHARLGHEPLGAWIMWASLPIIAVLLYELQARYDRRKALARAGSIYPAPMPQWGFSTWLYFPLSTNNAKRDIILARREALSTAGKTVIAEFVREATKVKNTRERIPQAPPEAPEVLEATGTDDDTTVVPPDEMVKHRERRTASPGGRSDWSRRHKPDIHVRDWARAQPEYKDRVGERGPIPADIKEAYAAANGGG